MNPHKAADKIKYTGLTLYLNEHINAPAVIKANGIFQVSCPPILMAAPIIKPITTAFTPDNIFFANA